MNQKQAHLQTVSIPLDRLIPHPRNPNTHDDRQISKLRHLIKVHGFAKGSVVFQTSTHYLLCGHGVVQALKLEGYTHVDAVELDIDDAKAYSLMIADNKIADDSVIDNMALQNLISELSAMGVPSLDFGFDSDDLEKLASDILADSGGYQAEPQDDEIPEVVEPITQSGDLWTLGRHKLLVNDSTNEDNIKRLLDDQKAELCLTDPPYNYGIDYKKIDDRKSTKEYESFTIAWYSIAKKYSKKIVQTPGLKNMGIYYKHFDPLWTIAWVKENAMTSSKIGKLSVWEPVLLEESEIEWEPIIIDGKPTKPVTRDVFKYPIRRQKDTSDHPCPKLIAFWADLMLHFSIENDTILDLFLGSGSTMIACEKLNRNCVALEIDEHYADICIQRYIDFVGSDKDVWVDRQGQKVTYEELTNERDIRNADVGCM